MQLIALTFRYISFVTSQTLRKKENRIVIIDIYSPFLWLSQLFVPGNRRFLDPGLPVLYDVCWHQQKQKLFLMEEFYRYPRLVWPQNDKSAIMFIKRSYKFQRNILKVTVILSKLFDFFFIFDEILLKLDKHYSVKFKAAPIVNLLTLLPPNIVYYIYSNDILLSKFLLHRHWRARCLKKKNT